MRRGAPGIAPSWAAACRRRRGRASSGVCALATRGALVERRALRVGWRISPISRALWRPPRPRVRRIARGAPWFAASRARIRARRARATPGRLPRRAPATLARATASIAACHCAGDCRSRAAVSGDTARGTCCARDSGTPRAITRGGGRRFDPVVARDATRRIIASQPGAEGRRRGVALPGGYQSRATSTS